MHVVVLFHNSCVYLVGHNFISFRGTEESCGWRGRQHSQVPSPGLVQYCMQNSDELSKSIKELVIKEMDNELEELCKKKKNSILRQTKAEELLAFKIEKLTQEIERETPLLNQTLQSICCSNNKKRASTTSSADPCVKATIAASILHERCPEMSAIAYRTGLVLRHAGAGGMVGFIASHILTSKLLLTVEK